MNQFLQLFRCLWVLYFQIRGTDSVKTHLPFSANGKVGSCACIAIFIVSQICADEKPFLRPKQKKCGFFHPPNRILLPIAPRPRDSAGISVIRVESFRQFSD
jgi:hypothetical protein